MRNVPSVPFLSPVSPLFSLTSVEDLHDVGGCHVCVETQIGRLVVVEVDGRWTSLSFPQEVGCGVDLADAVWSLGGSSRESICLVWRHVRAWTVDDGGWRQSADGLDSAPYDDLLRLVLGELDL